MNNWLDWLPGLRPPPPVDDTLWRDGMAACPLAQRLPADDRQRLRLLVARFLQRKRFHPIEMELDALQRLLIALQACVPVLHLGFRVLRGWQGIVMYPGEFKVRHSHHDVATGVVTEREQVLAGEAWHIGPLVLSWANVQQDLLNPWDGFNVVVHEIAHKLDMLDGPPDGVPPLPRNIRWRHWIDTFQRAFDELSDEVHRGNVTPIDAYAATNPGEYFAVVSELHFSDPARLEHAEPAIAALLRNYYGPSPAPSSCSLLPPGEGA
ncbi:MAG TPA: M90 family metallopeptidase [Rhodanobacteraceae bacterium]|nr:M90 family metallopeptidase [Rhodanobacteraceae bacterium]